MGLFSKKKKELPPPPPPYVPHQDHSGAQKNESVQVPRPPLSPKSAHAEPSPAPQQASAVGTEQDTLHIPPIHSADSVTQVHTPPEQLEQPKDVPADTYKPKTLDDTHPSPLFVGVSDYETILEGVEGIKQGLGETEGHVAKILELKQKQERTLDDWQHHLEEIQKKLTYVDEVIFRSR